MHCQILLLFLPLQVLLLTYANGNLLPAGKLAFSEVCRPESIVEYMDGNQSAREKFDEHKEYTSEWIVKIADGDKTADEIADRHGFINEGPASFLLVTCTV